ncbi:MAG TPA: glycine cleavage T C-terminal barrel domain-containing protein [Polyangia bacterium]
MVRNLDGRARFRLTGPDRVRFLHGLVTNDIKALGPGQGCRAAMLTVKGKTLCELAIYADEEALDLELDGELREKIRATLEKHMMMDDVELTDRTDETRELGVYGDGARAAIERALSSPLPPLAPYHHVTVGGVRVAAAPELAVDGYHLVGELGGITIEGDAIDDARWEILRVEAGRPRYGVDVDEDRLILEAGMEDAVSLTKGCYLGQEVVARATARGHINRKLVGLTLGGEGEASRGARLSGAGRDEAGLITSSVVSPRFGPIALGYVHRSLWEPGTALTVHDPKGERTARVVALPFR